ncbi:class I SAM-dependent methyltransferase [Aestuariivirga sp.]|uniref:class I SAM-dependent methyltransferase n=1 Tax=Aestuariivirga sp. TaxID=2650926 RepID=UPI003BABE5E7
MRILDRAAFIRANTSVMTPPLVPEVSLHLAHEAVPLWQKTEEELGEMGLPPPFWAFAWAGGQALARHVLDHPGLVNAKRVVDLASGSGLVGLAAMTAGAQSVCAADIDGFSVEAIRLNAALNGVTLDVTGEDLLLAPAPDCDVILVGDLFYEKALAAKVFAWLEQAEERGILTLIGDPGRSYLPREKLSKLGEYKVEVTRDLEDAEIKMTSVWRLSRYC